MVDRIISRAELQKLTGRSRSTIKRWDRERVGPPIVRFPSGQKQSRVGYRLSDVEHWIDSHVERAAAS
jgi:predicted DNA-binding transcriptional regulator AlpA